MNLGTLLAAGKSLALRRRGESPYRANKQFYLPKFGSPKNPFASANQPGEAISPEEAAAAPVKTPITVVAAKTQKLPTFSPAPRAANTRPTTGFAGPEAAPLVGMDEPVEPVWGRFCVHDGQGRECENPHAVGTFIGRSKSFAQRPERCGRRDCSAQVPSVGQRGGAGSGNG